MRKVSFKVKVAEKLRTAKARSYLARLRVAKVPDMEIAFRCGVSLRTLYRWRDGAVPRGAVLEKLRKLVAAKGA